MKQTYEETVKALRNAVVETPFPETEDKGSPGRRSSRYEPYALSHPRRKDYQYLLFISKDGSPRLWKWACADDREPTLVDVDDKRSYTEATKQTNWSYIDWYMACGPMIVTNWIEEQRR